MNSRNQVGYLSRAGDPGFGLPPRNTWRHQLQNQTFYSKRSAFNRFKILGSTPALLIKYWTAEP